MDKIKAFWDYYDKYIESRDESYMSMLSYRLSEIEKPGEILKREEKGWTKILAWQALRSQTFHFEGSNFELFKGDILYQNKPYDRDCIVTRVPIKQAVSGGYLLLFGTDFSSEIEKCKTESEKVELMRYTGLANNKGLYLPLYDSKIIVDFIGEAFKECKKAAIREFLKDLR